MKRIAYLLSLLRKKYMSYRYDSQIRRLRQTVEESSEIRSVSDGVYVDGSYIFVRGVPIAKITDDSEYATLRCAESNMINEVTYNDAVKIVKGLNSLHYHFLNKPKRNI